ncbi:hypothetical protein ACLXAZ_33360, partial [Escherichia coli]
DVIIVDSVAALVPKAEIEGEMGDAHVGLQARLMSQALRKITGNIKNANCLVIFINQIDVIIVDSVAALVPKAEIEGEMGDAHVGLQARL